jgi:AcrR family transcriptional regulator
VSAATALFAERGFDGATVEQIAQRAGVNKAMINYHFGGKRGLYAAILKGAFEGLAREVSALRASSRPADELLRELIGHLGATMARHPGLPAMLVRELLSGGLHVGDELLPHFLSVFMTTREAVERGVRSRRFRRVDPTLTHLAIVGSLVFFFATERFRERKIAEGRLPFQGPVPTAPRFVAHLQDLMAHALEARRPARRSRRSHAVH